MEAKDIKWCPQHGYPLPCYKCGMPLSSLQQKEIYELGKVAGIREVVESITPILHDLHVVANIDWVNPRSGFAQMNGLIELIETKLKELEG